MVSQYHSLGKYFVVGRTACLNVFTCATSIFLPPTFSLSSVLLPVCSFFLHFFFSLSLSLSFLSLVGPLRFLFTATQFFSGEISLPDEIRTYRVSHLKQPAQLSPNLLVVEKKCSKRRLASFLRSLWNGPRKDRKSVV